MINYEALSNVLGKVPQAVRKEDSESQLLSYMLDAYRNLKVPTATTEKITILDVVDHKVFLPKEVSGINFVSYLCGTPTYDQCCELEQCCTAESTYYIIDLYSTSYYRDNFCPIKYIGTGSSLCSKCINRFVNSSIETFSVDSNSTIWTSFKDGSLCVHYETELKNDDGEYLIIKDEDVSNYLSYHAQYQHWLNRLYMHEEGTNQIINMLEGKVNIYYRRAIGSLLQSGINKQLIQELTTNSYNNRIITFLPDNFRRKFDTSFNF